MVSLQSIITCVVCICSVCDDRTTILPVGIHTIIESICGGVFPPRVCSNKTRGIKIDDQAEDLDYCNAAQNSKIPDIVIDRTPAQEVVEPIS